MGNQISWAHDVVRGVEIDSKVVIPKDTNATRFLRGE